MSRKVDKLGQAGRRPDELYDSDTIPLAAELRNHIRKLQHDNGLTGSVAVKLLQEEGLYSISEKTFYRATSEKFTDGVSLASLKAIAHALTLKARRDGKSLTYGLLDLLTLPTQGQKWQPCGKDKPIEFDEEYQELAAALGEFHVSIIYNWSRQNLVGMDAHLLKLKYDRDHARFNPYARDDCPQPFAPSIVLDCLSQWEKENPGEWKDLTGEDDQWGRQFRIERIRKTHGNVEIDLTPSRYVLYKAIHWGLHKGDFRHLRNWVSSIGLTQADSEGVHRFVLPTNMTMHMVILSRDGKIIARQRTGDLHDKFWEVSCGEYGHGNCYSGDYPHCGKDGMPDLALYLCSTPAEELKYENLLHDYRQSQQLPKGLFFIQGIALEWSKMALALFSVLKAPHTADEILSSWAKSEEGPLAVAAIPCTPQGIVTELSDEAKPDWTPLSKLGFMVGLTFGKSAEERRALIAEVKALRSAQQ